MKQQEFLDLISTMPPLSQHGPNPEPEFHRDCPLVLWFLQQPGAHGWIAKKIVSSGRAVFDHDIKRWKGVPSRPRGRPRKPEDIDPHPSQTKPL